MKLILTILIFLSLAIVNEANAQKIDIENIYGVWYRSYEEEKGGIVAYRPKGYKFPPARAREKIEILKDGQIIESRVSPSDAYFKIKGLFSYCEKHNELILTFNDQGERKERIYRIIKLDKSIFKIKTVVSEKIIQK